jgi:hypothetical protein
MAFRMVRNERKDIERDLAHGIRFHWGSILAGTFCTLAIGLFFLLLGNAIGLSVNNAINPVVSAGLKAVSWVYMVVTMVAAYYCGSLVATRSNDEIRTPTEGGLHGLITWSFASLLGTIFVERASVTASRILAGTGPNSGNWLALFVMTLGFAAAVFGGMSGKVAASRAPRAEEEVEEERKEEPRRTEELRKTA